MLCRLLTVRRAHEQALAAETMWQWNNICYSKWHNVVVVVLAHKPSHASTLDGKRTLKEFIGLLVS